MRRALVTQGLVLVALACLAGCGGSGGPAAQPNPDIMYVNSVPDSTALDFRLNDTVEAKTLAYEAATPNFITASPNTYDVAFREHTGTQDIWNQAEAVAFNQDCAAIALGEENFGTENLKRAQLLFINVDRSVPNGTKARLIVVHAFNRATGLDTPNIDFQNPGNNPTFKLSNIGYATEQSFEVDAGSQEFQARRTGTDEVYVDKTLTLQAGKIYLILVTGIEGGAGAQAPDMIQINVPTKST